MAGKRDGLYLRGKIWWASYSDASGKRVRRSTGESGKTAAELKLCQWKLHAREARDSGVAQITFDELILMYIQAHGDKPSIERDRFSAKNLMKKFSEIPIVSIARSDILAYIESRKETGATAGTINREIGFLSGAINWGNLRHNLELPNPAIKARLKEPGGRIRYLEKSEYQSLIKAAEESPQAPLLAPFIQLAVNTGMRCGEMLNLEWERADMERRILHLEEKNTKTRRRRSVPLNQAACQTLLECAKFRTEYAPDARHVFIHRDGKRLKSVKRSFNTACKVAGIDDFHIHDLRHTCAAWLIMSPGVSLEQIRDLLGHTTIRMTERYAHLSPDYVRAAVDILDI
ncbi:MAG: site-specific integrase [Gammaproteobacteria bacterium]|nr:site-specific integrase [Gammaproteobacteria bacterium]